MMRALIFANGSLNPGPMVDEALAQASEAVLIAADGGARHVTACGLVPDFIIGDMDSLAADELARFQAMGVEIQAFPAAKDETDLELALLNVVERGVNWVRIIGGIGDRLDQSLANMLLLTLPALQGRDVQMVSGRQAAWILPPGEQTISGHKGDTLSLLPLNGDAQGVTTAGLAYPLRSETLRSGPARGISNVFSGPEAAVSLESGLLLVVHTLGRA